jgi:hypothetical protein
MLNRRLYDNQSIRTATGNAKAWQTCKKNRTMIYQVISIPSKIAYPFFKKIHYAKRIPSISYCFGLYENDILIGCCSFGTPASSTLLKGVAGEKWAKNVIELNRLVLLNNEKNQASFFISKCIKMLPKPCIIVSFADTSMSHNGYVYQACNFKYYGLSAKFKDPKVKGLEHKHHCTYANRMNKAQLEEKYGKDNVYYVDRSRKHKYIIIHASKTQRKHILLDFKYKELPYPKEENKKYITTEKYISTQMKLF